MEVLRLNPHDAADEYQDSEQSCADKQIDERHNVGSLPQ